jgi:hypothetical protein
MLAGILLVVLPTVMYGGLSLFGFLAGNSPGYTDNPLRHDLWRALSLRRFANCEGAERVDKSRLRRRSVSGCRCFDSRSGLDSRGAANDDKRLTPRCGRGATEALIADAMQDP